MKSFVLGGVVFLAATAACIGHITARTEMRATEEVCELLRENYYQPTQPDVQEFLKRCETENVPFTYTRAKALAHINAKLSRIHSSHLNLYSPAENRELWENEGSDTGIRARMIDGELVILGTLEESAARAARLRAGDVIVAINGEQPSSAADAQSIPGFYKIARDNHFFQVELKLEDLREDLSPQFTSLSTRLAVLRIPSFLPTYFEKDAWLKIAHELETKDRLVIDLRGNSGGSFPAMLRALSPFRCGAGEVGRLWRASRPGHSHASIMQDDLSTETQLTQMNASDEIILQTFGSRYGCFHGRVIVLVDSTTSSVSEIFALALAAPQFQNGVSSEAWGAVTAGQVVMARWFSIGSLGGGDYALSIPVAGFRAADGSEIEAVGVHVKRDLHYDLEAALHGEDSWLNDAVRALDQH